jgi:hypothetical protein
VVEDDMMAALESLLVLLTEGLGFITPYKNTRGQGQFRTPSPTMLEILESLYHRERTG